MRGMLLVRLCTEQFFYGSLLKSTKVLAGRMTVIFDPPLVSWISLVSNALLSTPSSSSVSISQMKRSSNNSTSSSSSWNKRNTNASPSHGPLSNFRTIKIVWIRFKSGRLVSSPCWMMNVGFREETIGTTQSECTSITFPTRIRRFRRTPDSTPSLCKNPSPCFAFVISPVSLPIPPRPPLWRRTRTRFPSLPKQCLSRLQMSSSRTFMLFRWRIQKSEQTSLPPVLLTRERPNPRRLVSNSNSSLPVSLKPWRRLTRTTFVV
mmetsp:Transcript_5770/g.9569  ORF Transcript_5770/g.9569 Transcript_5770/m.9569 type:complete len:263 (-) Transcript_5770:23-811(-)